uniref:Uncharacterized protein n=1 Tax=Romanomermis culicivorax TaxID=13658 RepID=A0A915JDS5_ROMCU
MAPHSAADTVVAGYTALDFRPYVLLIMINTALILTLILSIVACCDCCMEDDDRDYNAEGRNQRKTNHASLLLTRMYRLVLTAHSHRRANKGVCVHTKV